APRLRWARVWTGSKPDPPGPAATAPGRGIGTGEGAGADMVRPRYARPLTDPRIVAVQWGMLGSAASLTTVTCVHAYPRELSRVVARTGAGHLRRQSMVPVRAAASDLSLTGFDTAVVIVVLAIALVALVFGFMFRKQVLATP